MANISTHQRAVQQQLFEIARGEATRTTVDAAVLLIGVSAVIGLTIASFMLIRPLLRKDEAVIDAQLVDRRKRLFSILILLTAITGPDVLIVVPASVPPLLQTHCIRPASLGVSARSVG